LVAQLRLRTAAPLIIVRCYPRPRGRCRLVFGPEITFRPSGDEAQDIRDLTQKCMGVIEAYIREAPQFWIWGHKRWRFRKGEPLSPAGLKQGRKRD
jgi:lauroyl/myristoyl acyltransferase